MGCARPSLKGRDGTSVGTRVAVAPVSIDGPFSQAAHDLPDGVATELDPKRGPNAPFSLTDNPAAGDAGHEQPLAGPWGSFSSSEQLDLGGIPRENVPENRQTLNRSQFPR